MSTSDLDRARAIDELLIKQEISDLMMRYCRGVNRMDMDLVRSCFHPDAREDHGPTRSDAMAYVDGLGEVLKRAFVSTYHFIGNQLIEIQGSRASHEAYFIGYHRLAPDENGVEKDVLFGGRYLSVLESRHGGPWLFLDRTVVNDWSRVDPVTEKWPMAERFRRGQSGHGDLVFHLFDPDRLSRA
jgi:hypothetical protein